MRRPYVILTTFLGMLAAAGGCSSTPKMPTGPAPEYEEPPAPSWVKDASPAEGPPAPLPPVPAAGDAGTPLS